MSDESDPPVEGCAFGAVIGGFVLPILYVLGLYYSDGHKAPGSVFVLPFAVLVAIVGAVLFGTIGWLVGAWIRRKKERQL